MEPEGVAVECHVRFDHAQEVVAIVLSVEIAKGAVVSVCRRWVWLRRPRNEAEALRLRAQLVEVAAVEPHGVVTPEHETKFL